MPNRKLKMKTLPEKGRFKTRYSGRKKSINRRRIIIKEGHWLEAKCNSVR